MPVLPLLDGGGGGVAPTPKPPSDFYKLEIEKVKISGFPRIIWTCRNFTYDGSNLDWKKDDINGTGAISEVTTLASAYFEDLADGKKKALYIKTDPTTPTTGNETHAYKNFPHLFIRKLGFSCFTYLATGNIDSVFQEMRVYTGTYYKRAAIKISGNKVYVFDNTGTAKELGSLSATIAQYDILHLKMVIDLIEEKYHAVFVSDQFWEEREIYKVIKPNVGFERNSSSKFPLFLINVGVKTSANAVAGIEMTNPVLTDETDVIYKKEGVSL